MIHESTMLTYYQYHDYVAKFYFGHALTDEHLNNATENIAHFVVNHGAQDIIENLGICIVERWRGERMLTRRFCFADRAELTIKQIMSLGLFLPYGAYFGKNDVSILRK